MADISSIKLPSGTTYTVKDSTARSHISNTSNPHGVTKSQVGLGSVANYDQSKAIKSISRSGTTFTATALDETTFTFTQAVYTHPSTHAATMISTDASHRFVSDSEKSAWNSKAAGNHTHDLSGLINNLSIGTSNPEDADYFVSQYAGGGTSATSYYRRPISTIWNYIKSKADSVYQAKGSYASTAAATQSANGLMSAADKTKLDSLSTTSVSAITNSEIDTIIAN